MVVTHEYDDETNTMNRLISLLGFPRITLFTAKMLTTYYQFDITVHVTFLVGLLQWLYSSWVGEYDDMQVESFFTKVEAFWKC